MNDFIFNGPNKLIIIQLGITNISVRELWSRWVDWLLISDNSKFDPAFSSVGGDNIDVAQGTKIPLYAFLLNGWKLRPQESNHTLTIRDGVIVVDGGGDPFTNTLGAFTVRINYQQPVQAISFSTGSGGGTSGPTKEEIRQEIDSNSSKMELIRLLTQELHRIQGLDINNPMTVTPSSRVSGDIELEITGDGSTFTEVQRQ